MRGSVWQFCYVSAHFRHILAMFVLIRNIFYRVQSKKSPLDAEYTSGGVFFGKNGTPAFRRIFSFVSR